MNIWDGFQWTASNIAIRGKSNSILKKYNVIKVKNLEHIVELERTMFHLADTLEP